MRRMAGESYRNRGTGKFRYRTNCRRGYPLRQLVSKQPCKPSSVFDNHLSRPTVAGRLQPPSRGICRASFTPVRCCSGLGLHGRAVTSAPVSSYLAFPALPCVAWRYISVALSLKSPSVGVTHNPALRSSDFPRMRPFGTAHAIVWSTCCIYYISPAGICQFRRQGKRGERNRRHRKPFKIVKIHILILVKMFTIVKS